MLSKDKIERINVLAKKAKEEGLSAVEKKEQEKLRQEYLQNVRSSFKNQFKSMTVVDPNGNDVTPQKVKDMQNQEKDKE
ncbi:MAG: DUF896 domain-containing protein [Bacillota bacterium]|uniref:UPF0291 protein KCX74_09005 n=1 Tax=Virgibacillus salarius TaxID=447199 RepID=A0A941DT68_9BACI|nr:MULTISPECIES: DUF896 domain-containing protein [Bacillaceae]NAZ08888.1 DUF896 domain-containing protein [Agaribacter marinus]MBR7796180.1 DUF896 domain-containing protein [Virgibacillus salarius]MCC2249693.1 DUF896 domain-containing protein [Virgibacillus sp. AGTR]MDY7042684.1 DUF896 domain-containing protein [Virgibacillus sp. M23]QRZ17138.1 DUF896 domain-containing protein [Virgibacillus sp. AGTR]